MLLKEESLMAVLIYFLQLIQSPIFEFTNYVRQAPQNLWLQGWTLAGLCIISKQ